MSESTGRLSAALADRYRIIQRLGEGGMATVYLAEDLKHKRQVAVKVLKPELAAVLGAERFVQEITTTASLQHPHILPLFDSGEADSFLYYVMPYIEGETLRDKLNRETQLGIDEAVKITTEVADALDYAHRHGVIHRDIKPENILLHDGRPMVADFGIALAVSAAAGGRMTETGLSLGTPHYMSPEQATAEKDLTNRSDIYSLGAVLYEMLTGEPPHMGTSAQQIVMKIVTEDVPPVTRLRKAVPPHVAAAVAKAVEKLPADRFESAKAFLDALADPHFTVASPGIGPTPAALGGGRRLTFGLGAALVVMTVVAMWALLRPAPPLPVIRYAMAFPSDQTPVVGGFALLTSDGARLVYAGPSAQPDRWQIWVKARDRLAATPLLGTDGVSSAALSPDDASIAFVQGNTLLKMPLAGGAIVALAEDASNAPGSVTWLDDGTILYVTVGIRPFQIAGVAGDGGPPKMEWSSDSLAPGSLTPLPNGRGVLLQLCPAPCNRSDVYALDLKRGGVSKVADGARAAYYLKTGDLAFIANGTVLVAPFDLASLQLRGAPVAMIDSVSLEGGTTPYFAVSASGTVVTRRGRDLVAQAYRLVWVDRTGRETMVDSSWTFRVTQFAGNYGWALSPDGTRLAIGLNTPEGDDIWVKPLPRGPASRVTFGASSENRPRWAADGRSVTFVAADGLVMRRADGTGMDSLLYRGPLDEGFLSHDGRWVILRRGATSAASGGRDIYGFRLGADSTPLPLVATPYDEMAMALSPDDRWLAYQSDETGQVEVYIRPFPNTGDRKVQVSSGGGTGPVWARDGHELYYRRGDLMMMAVHVTTDPVLQVGDPEELFRIPDNVALLDARFYAPWDVGPDGRFIMARSVSDRPPTESPLVVVENWFAEVKASVYR